jgi:glycosyltransferase involved in cell wall biosynthesis
LKPKPCLLIPIFDHKDGIGRVVASLEACGLHCFVIDDGSDAATRAVLDAIEARHPWLEVSHRERNGGRGAALKTGYRLAAQKGYTHVIQLDADGQHDAGDVKRFLAEVESDPEALVLGTPIFDESVPKARLYGRQLSRGMVWLTTLSFDISDPLCGFRGIPLAATVALLDEVATGDAMEFDPELVIRLHWRGIAIRTVPTRVVYEPGGLSHFHMLGDNARMTWVYARSLAGMGIRLPLLLRRRVAVALRGRAR